jgi:hypothetical protein
MGFYDRLIIAGLPQNEPHIPVHQLMAALGEYERGFMTAAEIATAFSLSAAEQTEAANLLAQIVTPLESVSIGGFVTLTNIGTTYDATSAAQGLGIGRIQCAGINGMEFTVFVNKIGNGTQSWQLWNETDGAETTVIDDTGATGAKFLSVQRSFPTPLAAGFKTFRVRAKSTTAADDPIFFGSCVLISRVSRLSSAELHEILLLTEYGVKYNDVVSLKARLGVT